MEKTMAKLKDEAGLKRVWEKIVSSDKFLKDIFSDMDMSISQIDDIGNILPDPFEFYNDRRQGSGFVMNVKAKGFPDEDDFIDGAYEELKKLYQKKMKASLDDLDDSDEVEEALRRALKTWFDSYMETGFWDDVHFEKEKNEQYMPNGWEFTVTGRSGGYWGITTSSLSSEDLAPSNKLISKMKEWFKEWYDNYEYENDIELDEEIPSPVIESAAEEMLLDKGQSGDYDDDSYWQMSKEATNKFKSLEKIIKQTIEYLEDKDRLIEQFMENEYYNQFEVWKYIDSVWDAQADRQQDFQFENENFGKKILITEDTTLPGTDLILERGDKIQVLKEGDEKAITFFRRNHFDGQDMILLAHHNKIEKIVVNKKANNMINYNRRKFNNMDGNQQNDYMANLRKIKTDYEVYMGEGSFFTIPSYAALFLMKEFPNIPVESKE
jgi:hypothetical protein